MSIHLAGCFMAIAIPVFSQPFPEQMKCEAGYESITIRYSRCFRYGTDRLLF
jgi:hypothetical protein